MSRILPITLALGSLIAVGCGPKNNLGPIDGATAQGMGNSMGNSAEASAGGFANPSGSSMASGCVTGSAVVTPAQPVDSDADGVPDNVQVTYTDCTFPTPDGGGTEDVNGTITWSDPTPSAGDYDSQSTVDLTNHLAANVGQAFADLHVTGSRSISGAAAITSSFTMSDTTTLQGTTHSDNGDHTGSQAKSWSVTYDSNGPWALGTPLINGTLGITGSESDTYDGHHADVTISAPSLTITPTCATWITAGTLTGTFQNDSQAATITVVWNSCGNKTVSYTGP